MANTNAPFGFQPFGHGPGSAPNFELSHGSILYSNSNKIYRGDPVQMSAGYIVQATAGTDQISGVFWGCKYYDTAQKITVNSPYWPGANAASGTVVAYIIDDPQAKFIVQATSTAIGVTGLNLNGNFTIGTGSTTSGRSGASLDTPDTTNTKPFRVVDLYSNFGPPGQNGTDSASSYNWVVVTFNNVALKQLTGYNP